MNSTTLVMGFSSVGLMVFGLALFVYQLALSPADEQPDVGVKGLKRAAIMEEGGLFNVIEWPHLANGRQPPFKYDVMRTYLATSRDGIHFDTG